MIYEVYVTPASAVGGEFPRPARITRSKKTAERYAEACRSIGQKARIHKKGDHDRDHTHQGSQTHGAGRQP